MVRNIRLGLRLVTGLALGLGIGLVLSFRVFQSVLCGTISSAQHYSCVLIHNGVHYGAVVFYMDPLATSCQ